jgi:hypothetical protein
MAFCALHKRVLIPRPGRQASPLTVPVTARSRRLVLTLAAAALASGGEANLQSALRRARLRVGTKVELGVSAPKTIGKVARYTPHSRRSPRVQTLCLTPAARTPGRCP